MTSTSGGISSLAPGRAVVIDVLGGVLEVELAVGEAIASVADGKPKASADVVFAHVKALNILTPDPDDALIETKSLLLKTCICSRELRWRRIRSRRSAA